MEQRRGLVGLQAQRALEELLGLLGLFVRNVHRPAAL